MSSVATTVSGHYPIALVLAHLGNKARALEGKRRLTGGFQAANISNGFAVIGLDFESQSFHRNRWMSAWKRLGGTAGM